MRDSTRYLAITDWAKARYTVRLDPARTTILITGPGPVPSRYRRIEDLAAARYLQHRERFPGLPIRNCPAFA
jgi:hypothetical protein